MNAKTFEDFEFAARAAGFEEVLERRWAPDTEVDVHTHNFEAEALVTQSPGSRRAGRRGRTCAML